jgi:hypothetical protein
MGGEFSSINKRGLLSKFGVSARNVDAGDLDAGQLKEDGLIEIRECNSFDDYISRTFGIDELQAPKNVEYLTRWGRGGGVTVMQVVINIYILHHSYPPYCQVRTGFFRRSCCLIAEYP